MRDPGRKYEAVGRLSAHKACYVVAAQRAVSERGLRILDASAKRTILAFTACYLPGYKGGGPIRSVANIADRLGDEFSFRVFTSDRDYGDGDPYPGIALDCWVSVGNAQVRYATRRGQAVGNLVRLLRNTRHDVLYFNSLFNPRFTLLPLVLRRLGLIDSKPVVLAPRGELDAGALALKPVKKRTFLTIARWLRLYSGITWQASSELEARRVIEVMGAPPDHVLVAPNLPGTPGSHYGRPGTRRPGDPLVITFLSRISRKKNLDFALCVLRDVHVPVSFLIYGVTEDKSYWSECLRLIDELPDHIRVEYRGDVQHSQVHEVLSAADLFFLPTKGENYGHVILEALAAGLPVLISDQTPWADLAERGAGWVLPLEDTASFAVVISEYANDSVGQRTAMSERARAYAEQVLVADTVLQANIALFRNALAQAETAVSRESRIK